MIKDSGTREMLPDASPNAAVVSCVASGAGNE
jgi:hypothetical protein